MKLFKRIIFYTVAGLLLFNIVSCKKDETLRYGNVTMGNRVNGKFISDQGNTFNLVEINAKINFDKFRRGIMQCDVLREVGEKEYDVRVTYLDTVLTKSPVLASIAAAEADKTVEDPIHIEQLWVAGGYINMYIMFEIQVDPLLKDSKHMVNLILDDSRKEEGKYSFTLRHNAFGETFKPKDDEQVKPQPIPTRAESSINWGFAGSYVSFPIADLIKEKTAEITLNWTSHVITDFAWSATTEQKNTKLNYSKDMFEHAPLNIKTRTSVPVR